MMMIKVIRFIPRRENILRLFIDLEKERIRSRNLSINKCDTCDTCDTSGLDLYHTAMA